MLDPLEGVPSMSKNTVCMLLAAALSSVKDNLYIEVKQGYFIKPVVPIEGNTQ